MGGDILIPAIALLAAVFGSIWLTSGKRYSRGGFGRRSRSYGTGQYTVPPSDDGLAQYDGHRHFGQQMESVMASTFEKRRIMNASEYRVFRVIEQVIASTSYRLFAQTSLGEILQSKDESAFYSINSKRVDVLVVDRGGWPALAIEYQGKGHFKGTAAARDAIKKEALRKAGVRYLEVLPDDTDEQIQRRVREHLGLDTVDPTVSTPPPSPPPALTQRSGFGLRIAAP